eukprot:EC726642.1.p1 GENE.EC726642.1~~EC726642.1.p1  ORF type:complete len:171 (+),score=20.96 EC726642.1:106-618(+)
MEWQVSPSLDYEPPVNCKRKRDSPADAPPDSECDTYAKRIERLDLGSPHLPLRLTSPRRMKEIAIRKLLERKASHIFHVIERAARELYGRSLGDIRNHGVLEQQLLSSCAALQTAPSSLSCKAAFALISPFYAAVVQAPHVASETKERVVAVVDMLSAVLDVPPVWSPFG